MAKILTTDNLSTIWSKINSTFAKKTEIPTSPFKYKGTISTNTALPKTYEAGDVYYVKTAGEYVGQTCEVGDMLICITTQSSGTSVNNAHWTVVQNNWSVTAGSSTLSWDTEQTLATVGGVAIKAKMPAAPTSVANATTASKLGTATKGSTTKPIYLNAGAPTECTAYAGGTAVTLNGASKAGSTASFYAPTSAGDNGQILKNNNGTPTWTTPDYVTNSNADATYLKKTDAAGTYLKNNVIKLTTDDYGKLNNSLSDSQINILKSGEPTYLDYTYKNGGTVVYYKGLIGGMLTTNSTTTFEYPVLCKGSDFDYLLLSVGSDKKVSVAKKQFKDSIDLSNVDNWYTENENGELGSFSLPKDFVADEETFEYNATIATRDWVEAQYATSTYLTKSDAASTYLEKDGAVDKLHVEDLPEVDMVSPTGGDNEYKYLEGAGTPLINNLCYLDLAIENIEGELVNYLSEDQFVVKLNELLGGELEGYFATTNEINNILK